MSNPLKNRYDFLLIFDVQDGNPNGDPDAGNLPRIDAETGRGLVTDVCLKRKVRNYVALKECTKPPYDIYIKEKAILNQLHEAAYKAIGAEDALKGADKKRKGGDKVNEARDHMCATYYDVRTFGAVMSTGINCGQVRGPVQMTFARSVDPIVTLEHSITRMAVATEAEAEKQQGDNRTMGRKMTVPYGIYVAHGFISAHLAAQTGFSETDLELLLEALSGQMFEHDRSAARGLMATRKLFVFKHQDALGNAPAHTLFEAVKVARKPGVSVARAFSDYTVSVEPCAIPQTVELMEIV